MAKKSLNVLTQRITLKKYNRELEKSILQAKAGKTIKHRDLLKEMTKW